jgi:hypothetical protein
VFRLNHRWREIISYGGSELRKTESRLGASSTLRNTAKARSKLDLTQAPPQVVGVLADEMVSNFGR